MELTIDLVVNGLKSQGYTDKGGSEVWRLLEDKKTQQQIKVYYNNYEKADYIVIRESVEGR